ncbi:Ras GTPase ras2, variant 2 [Orbilia ellipsospora]
MCMNHFVETYDPTIEDSYRKNTTVDDKPCILEILDTAGQEEYKALRSMWIHEGEGFFLVYSISARHSFVSVRQFYNEIVAQMDNRINGHPDHQDPLQTPRKTNRPVICLIGNKSDRTIDREVETQEGFALARELGCDLFFEVSCKDATNVETAVHDVVREMRNQRCLSPVQEVTSKIVDTIAVPLKPSQPSQPLRLGSFRNFFRMPKARLKPSVPTQIGTVQQIQLNRLLVQTARKDKRRTAKRLLTLGADPNGDVGADGNALYASAAMGNTKMVALLLDNGGAINACDTRGSTPLLIAAAEGHTATVKYLLSRGALVDAHNGTHESTALISATFRGHLKVVQLLIQNGANVNKKGGQYGTALHTAAVTGNEHIAKILLDSGASITARDGSDCTSLQVAAAEGHAGIVQLLLFRGARSIINDTRGRYGSAWKAANERSRFEVMRILLECGATEGTLSAPPSLAFSTLSPLVEQFRDPKTPNYSLKFQYTDGPSIYSGTSPTLRPHTHETEEIPGS